jgi:S-formylglutathione hydrolase FrmB
MAHLRCDFYSDVLEVSTSMTVLLPQASTTQIGLAGASRQGPPPVLYLLHGLSDDDTIWLRRTSIERYVAPLGLAVVMPQVGRSFYSDMAYGGRYWTFLSNELPEIVSSFFRVSDRRQDTFVAGLSMGGYGALKWALRQPHRFAAAASLSGGVDVAGLASRPGPREATWRLVAGQRPIDGTDGDLFALAQSASAGDVRPPPLYVCCGTEDELYVSNVRFVDTARRHGLDLTVDFGPGEHVWDYWDAKIQDVLAWMPLNAS